MSTTTSSSDADLLDLLRCDGPLGVAEMAEAVEVTPTAIRQRLVRLLAQDLVRREAERCGRGRPRHRYRLTAKGLRLTGSNFTDLALALWSQLKTIQDDEIRSELVGRVVKALAEGYAKEIRGSTTGERMRSLAGLLSRRRVPFSVEGPPLEPVLTAHACPYPDLAQADPSICQLEQMLFSELLGEDVQLTQNHQGGRTRCQFQPS
ncbi:MAG: helix-turn-helix transcriptional regulator [Thermoguttaceae bacterium]